MPKFSFKIPLQNLEHPCSYSTSISDCRHRKKKNMNKNYQIKIK